MNVLDIIIILVIGVCAYVGYRRGFIKTVFQMISFFISVLLANGLYPFVSQGLRRTALYDNLKNSIIESMELKTLINDHAAQAQSALIDKLPLPEALRSALRQYNTPDVYTALNVQSLEDYISGYFANLALNALSLALVFVLVSLLMHLMGKGLDVIGKLPVISTFNHAGGLVAGLGTALLIIWLCLALAHVLFISPNHPALFDKINHSLLARWFYNNNGLLNMLTKV